MPVSEGAIPVHTQGPADPTRVPSLLVVPSIYGPTEDLLRTLAPLAVDAQVVVVDPFWRAGAGPIAYEEREKALSRLRGFDLERCFEDVATVTAWVRASNNGHVVGLGICFGGPIVMRGAVAGTLDGVVTWHGSRMEIFLEGAENVTCPLRLHFGEDDPISPPAAIATIRDAFSSHTDASVVVHPGLVHGYTQRHKAYNADATAAGVEAARELLAKLA